VFYRTNAQSRVFEEIFIRAGLPYKVVGGVRFYERKEVRDALAYLRVITNPLDVVSLRRILNTPRRGIGDRSETFLEVFAEQEQIPFAEALMRADEVIGMAARSKTAIADFVRLLGELRELAASDEHGSPSYVLEQTLIRTGYLSELQHSADPQDEGRVENLTELVSVAAEFEEQRAQADEPADVDAFLGQVSLVADADSIPDASGGVVTLMTLHTAKGLEFPAVFLTGMEDGIFPHQRTFNEPAEMAEERRLAYVGITRARQRLYLSRSLTRSAWGQPSFNLPSRFLDEIPAEHIEWTGAVGRKPFIGYGDDEPASGRYADHGYRAAPRGPASARTSTPSFGGRRPDKPIPELAIGDRVSHDGFGLGTVVDLRGTQEKAQAEIDFGSLGRKWLMLRLAPLVKL
jgi:DNA helicase-2/ATP-dependent DNA helicase PcrA